MDDSAKSFDRPYVDRVLGALRGSGWSVAGAGEADLTVSRGRLQYVVEVQVAREVRRPIVEALFARAILQARTVAERRGARALAVIGAPRITPRLAAELRDYAAAYAGRDAWGLVDAGHTFELHGEGLDAVEAAAPDAPAASEERPKRRDDPFSDLGQWMLKVLLAPRLPPELLAAPREVIRSSSQLAAVAGVSVPTAARFVAALRSVGLIDTVRGALQLVQVEEVLRRWRVAAAAEPDEIGAQWLLPPKDPRAALQRALASGRGCVALATAADALGFRFVHGAGQHVYLERASPAALEQAGLVRAGPEGGVDVFVRRPRFPEAVWRGRVERGGLLATDVLQTWLDVLHHPARGAELAEVLWDRVIEPRVVRGGER